MDWSATTTAGDRVSVDDVVAGFGAFGSFATGLDLSRLDVPALERVLEAHGKTSNQMAAAKNQILAAIDAAGGAPSASSRKATKSSRAKSNRDADRADKSKDMPNTQKRLAAGSLPADTVDLLNDAADATSPASVDGDVELLDRVSNESGDRARKTIRDWIRKKQDKTDREKQRKRQRAQRSGRVFIGADGMLNVIGKGDPVSGAALKARWEAEVDRLYRLDGGREGAHRSGRSDQQRGWDALVNILGASSDADSPQPASHPKHQVVITAPLTKFDGTDPDAVATLIGGGPLLDAELAHLIGDADILGLVFNPATGQPLYLGRATRNANLAQWLALIVRDGGCALCGADPSRCHAHHMVPYNAPARGKTDIDELALLCRRDHTELHAKQLTLVGTWNHDTQAFTWSTRPATPAETPPPRASGQKRPSRRQAPRPGRPNGRTKPPATEARPTRRTKPKKARAQAGAPLRTAGREPPDQPKPRPSPGPTTRHEPWRPPPRRTASGSTLTFEWPD